LKGELHAIHINTVTVVPYYKVDTHIDEAKLPEDKNAVSITPILGRIHSIQPTAAHEEGTEIILDTSVFVVGFYVGKGKPDDISSFLSKLIDEFRQLSPSNSETVCIQARCLTASLRCLIADGPMRSYLKRTKGHSGYWPCNRCIQKEEMINRAILLRNVDAPRRTDAKFLTYHTKSLYGDEYLNDIRDVSPFVKMDFPMVTGFIIDPMHTGIEGAFSR
jgi:hypothetical protein